MYSHLKPSNIKSKMKREAVKEKMTEIQQRYIDDDLHDQITTRYDVPDESETEKWSINTGKSSCTKILEEKLKKQRQDTPEAYAVLYNECPKC